MVTTPAAWLRLVGGLALVFALFQWSATTLHSDRGQAGLIVAALVVAATLVAEVVLFNLLTFAPIQHCYAQIRQFGRVRRGDIGLRAQTITPVLAAGLMFLAFTAE